MPEVIISASGPQYGLVINADGSINTSGGGGGTTAGSEFWIKGGSILNYDIIPTDDSQNNSAWRFLYLTSGTATGVTGSTIGSIVQFIGAGSYVQKLTWSNDLITDVGSFI